MILVDADACPVIGIIEKTAKAHGMKVTLFCDTAHVLESDYCEVKVIGKGADAVDFALVNACGKGDIVVTQDFGLAAMALAKGAYCIHQSGMIYTDDNITGLLSDRYAAKKARMASSKNHLKGPAKRTPGDDANFLRSLEQIMEKAES